MTKLLQVIVKSSSLSPLRTLPCQISEFISEQAQISVEEAKGLLDIGAVYHLRNTTNNTISNSNSNGNINNDDISKTNYNNNNSSSNINNNSYNINTSTTDGNKNNNNVGENNINNSNKGTQPHTLTSTEETETNEVISRRKPRRVFTDTEINEDDFVRVYLAPRRYPAATKVDWARCVLCETEDFLVVNKPSSVPSHATMDNARENVLDCLRSLLSSRSDSFSAPSDSCGNNKDDKKIECDGEDEADAKIPLFLPQRLDVETSGLMFVARNARTIKRMSLWQQRNLLKKRYKALLAYEFRPSHEIEGERATQLHALQKDSTIAAGLYGENDVISCFTQKSTVAPKYFHWSDDKNAIDPHLEEGERAEDVVLQRCESIVRGVLPPVVRSREQWLAIAKELHKRAETLSTHTEQSYNLHKCHDALIDWMWCIDDTQYIALQEIVLELVTGRTHQLRGQLHGLQRHHLLHDERTKTLRDFHIAGDRLYQGITSLDAKDGCRSCPHLALQSYSMSVRANIAGGQHELHFEINNPWWQSIIDSANIM